MIIKNKLEYFTIIFLVLAAIIPQITLLYAFVNFSLNYLSIFVCLCIILFLSKSNYKFQFTYFFKLFLFLLFAGILYVFESQGGLIIILSFLILVILIFNKFDNELLYFLIKRIFVIISLISFISYFLFLLGYTSPFTFYLNGRGIMYVHLFTLSDFDEFNLFNPNSWRFYGFFNEPGALAAMSGIFIVKENFRFKDNIILYIFVLCSFSTGIFVGLFFSYLYINYKKFFNIYFLSLFLVLLIFYFFGRGSSILFLSYLHEKMFYFTYDFFDFEEDRLRYSFLNYLNLNLILFFLYVSIFFFIPVRFIVLFILMGLYRHHFVLNSVPVLIIIFFSFFHLYTKKSKNNQLKYNHD